MNKNSNLLLFLSVFIAAQALASSWHEAVTNPLLNHKKVLIATAGAGLVALVAKQLAQTDYGAVTLDNRGYYWDWNAIDTCAISFPGDFLWGAGTSAYQVEGNCVNTDWHVWEHEVDADGKPRVKDKAGIACDHWNKYQEDIDLIEQIGLGVYRLSLAWDKIQPDKDTFDSNALEHYKNVVRALHERGIKVLIGFHHYADPLWFADLGGFTALENIDYFVRFCTHVFQSFHDDQMNADLWTIFNSPCGYAFHKYYVGDFPPGIKGDKQLTLTVLKHMCEAHVRVYQAAKKINNDFYIGLLKNIIQIDPWRPWHPLDRCAAYMAAQMTDACQFSFFTTGLFKVHIPLMVDIEYYNSMAPYSFDFVGLNYYSHTYIKNMQKMAHPDEIKTNNPNYTVYPEGLYRAIAQVSDCLCKPVQNLTGKEIPVYVTENGIAHDNPHVRKLFFERYLYALHKAIADGYNVKGYIYWALMDNYEWGYYGKKCYGLMHVDFDDPELKRTIKTDEGTQYFINCIQNAKMLA